MIGTSLTAGLLSFPLASEPRKKLLLSANRLISGRSYTDYAKMKAENIPGELTIVRASAGIFSDYRTLQLPLFAHSFFQDPQRPGIIIGSEKWATGAAKIDIIHGRVLKQIFAPENFRYFGHGAYLPDGSHFFLSAVRAGDEGGVLLAFEAESCKLTRVLELGAKYPHDIHMDSGGEWAAVICAGNLSRTTGEMTIVELKSGKILNRIKTSSCGHACRMNEDEWILGGVSGRAGETNLLLLDARSGKSVNLLTSETINHVLKGEALSLAKYDSTHCLVTTLDAQSVLVYNLDSRQITERRFNGQTLGLAVDADDLYISMHNKDNGSLRGYHGGWKSTRSDWSHPTSVRSFGNGRHMALISL